MYEVKINVDDGFVRISRNNKEMLYWEISEWESDPETVFDILSAVILTLTKPAAMDDKLREIRKL